VESRYKVLPDVCSLRQSWMEWYGRPNSTRPAQRPLPARWFIIRFLEIVHTIFSNSMLHWLTSPHLGEASAFLACQAKSTFCKSVSPLPLRKVATRSRPGPGEASRLGWSRSNVSSQRPESQRAPMKQVWHLALSQTKWARQLPFLVIDAGLPCWGMARSPLRRRSY
jgi:hypothetical protein